MTTGSAALKGGVRGKPRGGSQAAGRGRAQRLLESRPRPKVKYVGHPSFDDPGTAAVILGPAPGGDGDAARPDGRDDPSRPGGDPLLTREQEVHLFRKMNFLKHLAARLLESVDPDDPDPEDLALVEHYQREAMAINNLIVRANVRLVGSFVKKLIRPGQDFFEMLSDGYLSLIRASQSFDFSLGAKFSTYASWAIVNNFVRSGPRERARRGRFLTGQERVIDAASDQRPDGHHCEARQERLQEAVAALLGRLDDRERMIISRRFGFDGAEEKTLREVGEELGVTKERVRQLESRARSKLHEFATEAKLDPEAF
jgi:RNA polymerase primary sigma factor